MASEFDDFMGDGPEIPWARGAEPKKKEEEGESEFDRWFNQTDDKERLNVNARLGMDKNPDKSARVVELSDKTGMGADMVERNLEDLEKSFAQKDFDGDAYAQNAPIVSQFLSRDPNNFGAAKDDLLSLNFLERQFKNVKQSFNQGELTTELADIGQSAFLGTVTPKQRKRQRQIEEQLSQAKDFGITNYFAKAPGYIANQIPIYKHTLEEQAKGAAGGLVLGGGAGLIFGPAAPFTAAGGAALGWRLGVAMGSAKLEGGLAYLDYEKIKDKNGVAIDRRTAQGAALMVGALNATLETIGLSTIARTVPGLRGLTRTGVRQLLKNPSINKAFIEYAKNVGTAFAGEGATEGMQELVTITGQTLLQMHQDKSLENASSEDVLARIFSKENLARIGQSVEAGTLTGGGISSITSVPSVAIDIKKAKSAQLNYDAMKSITDSTKDMKILEKLPEQTREVIKEIAQDGAENVYIPLESWESHFQSKQVNPEEVLTEILGDEAATAWKEAKETGTPLPIPIQDYIEKISRTEHNDFFLREMRKNPEAFSLREKEEFEKLMDKQDENIQKGIETRPEHIVQAEKDAADFIEKTSKELEEAGHTPEQAKVLSGLMKGIETQAKRQGKTVQQILKNYSTPDTPFITRPDLAESPIVPPQTTPGDPAAKAFVDSLRRDGIVGTPLEQIRDRPSLPLTPEQAKIVRKQWNKEVGTLEDLIFEYQQEGDDLTGQIEALQEQLPGLEEDIEQRVLEHGEFDSASAFDTDPVISEINKKREGTEEKISKLEDRKDESREVFEKMYHDLIGEYRPNPYIESLEQTREGDPFDNEALGVEKSDFENKERSRPEGAMSSQGLRLKAKFDRAVKTLKDDHGVEFETVRSGTGERFNFEIKASLDGKLFYHSGYIEKDGRVQKIIIRIEDFTENTMINPDWSKKIENVPEKLFSGVVRNTIAQNLQDFKLVKEYRQKAANSLGIEYSLEDVLENLKEIEKEYEGGASDIARQRIKILEVLKEELAKTKTKLPTSSLRDIYSKIIDNVEGYETSEAAVIQITVGGGREVDGVPTAKRLEVMTIPHYDFTKELGSDKPKNYSDLKTRLEADHYVGRLEGDDFVIDFEEIVEKVRPQIASDPNQVVFFKAIENATKEAFAERGYKVDVGVDLFQQDYQTLKPVDVEKVRSLIKSEIEEMAFREEVVREVEQYRKTLKVSKAKRKALINNAFKKFGKKVTVEEIEDIEKYLRQLNKARSYPVEEILVKNEDGQVMQTIAAPAYLVQPDKYEKPNKVERLLILQDMHSVSRYGTPVDEDFMPIADRVKLIKRFQEAGRTNQETLLQDHYRKLGLPGLAKEITSPVGKLSSQGFSGPLKKESFLKEVEIRVEKLAKKKARADVTKEKLLEVRKKLEKEGYRFVLDRRGVAEAQRRTYKDVKIKKEDREFEILRLVNPQGETVAFKASGEEVITPEIQKSLEEALLARKSFKYKKNKRVEESLWNLFKDLHRKIESEGAPSTETDQAIHGAYVSKKKNMEVALDYLSDHGITLKKTKTSGNGNARKFEVDAFKDGELLLRRRYSLILTDHGLQIRNTAERFAGKSKDRYKDASNPVYKLLEYTIKQQVLSGLKNVGNRLYEGGERAGLSEAFRKESLNRYLSNELIEDVGDKEVLEKFKKLGYRIERDVEDYEVTVGKKVKESEYSFDPEDVEGLIFSTYLDDVRVAQGRFYIDHESDQLIPDDERFGVAITVDEKHRRKGIARELYRMASEEAGLPVADRGRQTALGGGFRSAIRGQGGYFEQTKKTDAQIKKSLKKSAIRDKKGNLLPVYSGSANRFEQFDPLKIGQYGSGEGKGFYFAKRKGLASGFAQRDKKPGYLYTAYLNITNPIKDINQKTITKSQMEKIFREVYKSDATILENYGDINYSGFENVLSLAVKEALEASDSDLDFIAGVINAGANYQAVMNAFIEVTGYDGVATTFGDRKEDIYVAFLSEQIEIIEREGVGDPSFDQADRRKKKRSPPPPPSPLGRFLMRPGPKGERIQLFERMDLTTFIHEAGHFYLEIMGDLATAPDATRQIKDDWQVILDYLGVKDRNELYEKQKFWSEQGEPGKGPHEIWARSFEAYTREGKAPSSALRRAFAKFQAWLETLYKSLLELNVNLSDDIRGVMDRMLATDEEIAVARGEQGNIPMMINAQDAGMSEDQSFRYANALEEANLEAKEKLLAKHMREVEREKKKWWKEESNKVRADVEDDLSDEPVYLALANLQRGKLPDGSELPESVEPTKLNKKLLEKAMGAKNLKKLPRPYIYSVKGGVSPDAAAAYFGFSSGDEMIKAILKATPYKVLVDQRVDKIMKQRHGDLLDPKQIKKEALELVHNESSAKVMHMELKHLVSKEFVKFKKLSRHHARPVPKIQEVRDQAIAIIGRKKVRDIRPSTYLFGERSAARKAQDFFLQGNFNAAWIEKRNQLLNHELYRASRNALDSIDKRVRYAKKFQDQKVRQRIGKTGGDYLEQIEAILDRYSFKKASLKSIDKKKSLLKWVQEQAEAGYSVDVPAQLLNEAVKKNYKDLSFNELETIIETVKMIEHLSKVKGRLLADKKARDIEQVEEEIVNSIEAHQKVDRRKDLNFTKDSLDDLKETGITWRAWHTKIEFLLERLDGYKPNGVMWRTFFQPFVEAENREEQMISDAAVRLEEIFGKAYTQNERGAWYYRKTYIPEIGTSMNKANMLTVGLYWGNEYNRVGLMEGYGWRQEQVEAILKNLEKKDWDMIQEIWDYIDEYWEESRDLEKQITGIAPEKTEAHEVGTQYGTYRGGYYPIIFDPKLSWKQFKIEEKDNIAEMAGGNWSRAMTKKGHLKQRTDTGGKPFKLELSGLSQHIAQVVHDLTHRRAVIDTANLIERPAIRSAIIGVVGQDMYAQIMPWLNAIAGERRHDSANPVIQFLSRVRNSSLVVSMGWKLTTALIQPTGYFISAKEMGEKAALNGLYKTYSSPWAIKKAWDFASKKSIFIRKRIANHDRDIHNANKNLKIAHIKQSLLARKVIPAWVGRLTGKQAVAFDNYLHMVTGSFFSLVGAADLSVSIPTWMGSYDKAMAGEVENIKKGDEEAAIHYADRTVRVTQGGGAVKDLAEIQRGPVMAQFTMFYSFFNVLYNMFEKVFHNEFVKGNAPALIRSFFYLALAPIVAEAIMRGDLPDEDLDDHEKALWWAKKFALYPLSTVVGLRSVNSFINGYGFELLPAAEGLESIGLGLRAILDRITGEKEELEREDIKKIVLGVGYAAGLPARQIWMSSEYFYDWGTGEEEPDDLAEGLYRGLVIGKEKKKR